MVRRLAHRRLTFAGPLTEPGSLTDGSYRLTVLSAQVSGFGQPFDGAGRPADPEGQSHDGAPPAAAAVIRARRPD